MAAGFCSVVTATCTCIRSTRRSVGAARAGVDGAAGAEAHRGSLPLLRVASRTRSSHRTAGRFSISNRDALPSCRSRDASGAAGGRVTAELDIDFAQEKMQVFRQAWTYMRDGFYDDTFHGVNWDAVRAQYAPRIAGAQTPAEMRRVSQPDGRRAEFVPHGRGRRRRSRRCWRHRQRIGRAARHPVRSR